MATISELGMYGVRMPTVNQSSTQSPVGNYPVVPSKGNDMVPSQVVVGQAGDSGNAPTISWLAILATLVLIRVAYERGARLE